MNKIIVSIVFAVILIIGINKITDIIFFVEKPEKFVSDLAIIGIYYFNDGGYLKDELQFLLDNNIKDKGEFQLTNALENMKNKGTKFSPGKVVEWLDCGNKDATVYTNERVLEYNGNQVSSTATIENSKIIEPCFIGKNAVIKNSKIGPYVSIGSNTLVEHSVISKAIIQNESNIFNAKIHNSMIGNKCYFDGKNIQQKVSIGDFSEIR